MTSAALTYADPVTISGTGPYPVPHEYAEEDIIAFAATASGAVVQIAAQDLTLDPVASDLTGSLYLSANVATTHDGETLYIRRLTKLVQGWSGAASAHEVSLTAQLDVQARAVQELQERIDRALVTFATPVAEVTPAPGQVLTWNDEGDGLGEGPDAGDIASAQTNAETVTQIAEEFGDVEAAIAEARLARDKSRSWADEAEDIEVEAGQYSAKHHSTKALNQRVFSETARAGAELAETGAEAARDLAETYAGVNHRATSWASLAATLGAADAIGYVSDDDMGTHTDPITSDTVDNAGVYEWAAAGLGVSQAKRIGDTGLLGKLNIEEADPKKYHRSGYVGVIADPAGWAIFGIHKRTGDLIGPWARNVSSKLKSMFVTNTIRSGVGFEVTDGNGRRAFWVHANSIHTSANSTFQSF